MSPLVRKGRGLIFPHFATESVVFELFLLREAISGATCVVTQLNPETLAQVSERVVFSY